MPRSWSANEDDLSADRKAPFGPTRESGVSMRLARGLALTVERAGLPRSKIFAAAELDPAMVDAPEARIPRFVLYRLCELALSTTADSALGLHWGERDFATSFAPLSQLIAHSGCLRQALESLFNFERLLSDEPAFQLWEGADEITLRCLPLPGESSALQRLWAELAMANLFRLMLPYGFGEQAKLSFAYSAPAYALEYARIFGTMPHFERPFTGFVFDRRLMEMPSPHKDEDIHDALRAMAEQRLMMLAERTPYALRVRELLVQYGWARRMEMKSVAHSLGLSVRSLRRYLVAEGKSYRALESEALAIVAKHLLRDDRRTILQVAYEMGFSDRSTFQRAFRNWTGLTPSSYRTSARAAAPLHPPGRQQSLDCAV